MGRTFTGRHMAAILVGFFGLVIVVNLSMARLAGSTFGGVVVDNSYVASQRFNGWLDKAEADRALGWDAVATWRPDGRLAVAVRGAPAGTKVTAIARHPLGRMPDRRVSFERTRAGRYLSREALPDGRWTLRLTLNTGERSWRVEQALQ